MSAKKILLLAGDYVEDYEIMVPFQMLLMVGHQVHAVCPGKKEGDTVATAIHDFEGDQTYSEKRGHNFRLNATFDDIDEKAYDALVIPGGRAPEYIRLDADVRRITEYFFEHDLPVGTICHGPQVPAVYGLLKGRKTAAFPPLWGDMENAGAILVDAPDVVDGNMVSCRGWPDMPEWSRAFMNVLERSAVPA